MYGRVNYGAIQTHLIGKAHQAREDEVHLLRLRCRLLCVAVGLLSLKLIFG